MSSTEQRNFNFFVRHENTSMLNFGCMALDFQLTLIASLLSLSSCDSTSWKVNISDIMKEEFETVSKQGKQRPCHMSPDVKVRLRSSLVTNISSTASTGVLKVPFGK